MRGQFPYLCSVVLLAGCYDVNLKDYKGGDGGRDAGTGPGVEVGSDRAKAEDAIAAAPDSFDFRTNAGADAGQDGPGVETASESLPDIAPDLLPDFGPDMGPDLGPAMEPDLGPDMGPDLLSDMPMRVDFQQALDIGLDQTKVDFRPVLDMGSDVLETFLTSGTTSSLSFGPIQLGARSGIQSFTITNKGQDTSGVIVLTTASSEFVIQTGNSSDCASSVPTLAAGASCSVSIVFIPAANGNRTGTVTFAATPGGGGSVALDGTGGCPTDYLPDKTGSCVPMVGVVWTQQAPYGTWRGVASSSDGTKLVAVADGDYVYTSTDSGVTWTQRDSSRRWNSVASSSDGTKLVAVVYSGYIYTSTDSGVTWTERGSQASWNSVASSSDGTKLVATDGSNIYTSEDSGVTWTLLQSSKGLGCSWVASSSDGERLAAVCPKLGIYMSADSGVTWTQRSSLQGWYSVASSSDGTKLAAVIDGGYIYTSADSGVTWTQRDSPQANWRTVASSSDGIRLTAVVYKGNIYTSMDSGGTWTQRGPSRAWWSVASSANGTKLVAVCNDGDIYTSNGPAP